jgi:hypothetical protein
MALDEFFDWYRLEPRPGFSKATVNAWRVTLDERGLGSSSIIVRMSAIRKLAVEATDNGLLADRRHADDDARRPQAAFLQGYAPRAHGGFGEARPRFLGIPAEELVQGHVVDPFRDRRRNRIEHEALHPPPFVCFVNYG